ncbi:MAG TPA: glycosyltransferase [Acidimicrobiia bacterium]|nr:glycosyltransferase [Acidimicrobiia bacterium]
MHENLSARHARLLQSARRVRRYERGRPPRILFVSTYPPTRCGIATFTNSLISELSKLRGGDGGLGVARLVTPDDDITPTPNVAVIAAIDSPYWPEAVARSAEDYDVVWIQHEFGIFEPKGSETIPALLSLVDKPVVTTFHTVLADPTPEQSAIMDDLLSGSALSVVLSDSARDRLLEVHEVDPDRLRVIPHGAGQFRLTQSPDPQHPQILTWGLLGPGKGIEWGIEAMARLVQLRPRPHYVVAGATHPNVLRAEGPVYRDSLESLATDLGVGDMVNLEDAYLSPYRLEQLLSQSQIVLLPYDSTEQVTSGVLVEAIAAGKPVVATGFPHAIELLGGGAGTVVPHRDPDAIAAAVERYLTDPAALPAAQRAAARIRPQLLWSSVARRTDTVAREAVRRVQAPSRVVAFDSRAGQAIAESASVVRN